MKMVGHKMESVYRRYAIASIAAHCDGCSGPCSRTIRTARSRTSGEYLVGRPIEPILSTNGPSDQPGTIHASNFVFMNSVQSDLLGNKLARAPRLPILRR